MSNSESQRSWAKYDGSIHNENETGREEATARNE